MDLLFGSVAVLFFPDFWDWLFRSLFHVIDVHPGYYVVYTGIVTAVHWRSHRRQDAKQKDLEDRIRRLESTNAHPMFPLATRKVGGYPFGKPTFYLTRHCGTDYEASVGTQLYAPFDGFIANQGNGVEGGLTIAFRPNHDNVVIRTMHLSKIFVKTGDRVRKGDLIGLTGNTGKYTDGPHLHVDVSTGSVLLGKPFPANFTDPEKYDWDYAPNQVAVPVFPNVAKYPPNGYPQATVTRTTNVRTSLDVTSPDNIVETLYKGDVQDVWRVVEGPLVNGSRWWFDKPNGYCFTTSNTDYDGDGTL